MKVYVESKFENKDEVQVVMNRLRAGGHEVVGDWTRHTVAGLRGARLVARLARYAQEDLAAIEEADAVLHLPVPVERTGSGAHLVEFGYALALGKLVLVLWGRPGAPATRPIFFFDPRVQHFDSLGAAVEFLTWADTAFAENPVENELVPIGGKP